MGRKHEGRGGTCLLHRGVPEVDCGAMPRLSRPLDRIPAAAGDVSGRVLPRGHRVALAKKRQGSCE